MARKVKYTAKVSEISWITEDVFSLWLENKDAAAEAMPGQFAEIYCNDKSRLLPRPISICDVDEENGRIRFCIRAVGAGTNEFSALKVGDTVKMVAPLGNGFKYKDCKNALIVGGGVGIFPLLLLTKKLTGKKTVVLGYRTEPFFVDEFKNAGAEVLIATDDGSVGTKGTVIDCIKENSLTGDLIFACGPMPMLRGLKSFGEENEINTQLSLEERMACGLGACLGCVVKTPDIDGHSYVNNKRVCKDGPVFEASQVII